MGISGMGGFALEKARSGWALGLDADFAHSTRRIIEEYTRSIGSLDGPAHTLLFMVNYYLASRHIMLYIAHESNERLRPLLNPNNATNVQSHECYDENRETTAFIALQPSKKR